LTKRKLFGLVALLLGVMLLGLTACSAADMQSLKGILKNVDSLSGNVTVTLKDGSTQTFNLANINLDTILNTPGNLSFDIGDNVTVKINKHGKITGIGTQNAEADGFIKSLGTDNVTITTDNNSSITLKVTPFTLIITKSEGRGLFSDLQVGQTIEARYNITNMTALKIKTDYQKDTATIWGTIKAMSLDYTFITITTQAKGDINLKITPETVIWIWGKASATASDLKADQSVTVQYNLTTLQATNITVDLLKNQGNAWGTIKTISSDNSTVTITTLAKGDINLKITPETVIWIWGKASATASDLTAGQSVMVQYNLTTLQATNITATPAMENHPSFKIWNNKWNQGNQWNQGNKDKNH
jgi:hypothetical protein